MNENTVAVAANYPTTREDLWSALVSHDRLHRWFGEVTTPSEDTSAVRIAVAGTGEVVHARILSCVLECRLTLQWSVDDEISTVSVMLGDADAGAALILQEDGVPSAMLDAYRSGWGAHLVRLGAEIAGESMPSWSEIAGG